MRPPLKATVEKTHPRKNFPPSTTGRYPMPPEKRALVISFLLAIAVVLAFWQVVRNDFITYDDMTYVAANPYIRGGLTLKGIGWAFATGRASNWHPLTWTSHMGDVQLFGMHQGWHHLVNLLFHLAGAVLLFLVLYRMTKALWQSAFVAALFALHPLHVESVAWAAERKDVLSTFLWMLAIWVYISYTARPWAMRYLALLVCFALGLMAKPMLVTLPFVLLLLDYWPLRRIGRKKPSIRPLLAEKVPLFVLAGLSSIVTYLVQYHGGAVKALPPGARPGNAFVSSIAYIVKIFWPANLAVLYPYPERLPLWKVAGAAAILFALTALALKAAKKCPYATVGWFWHLGTLVPVIGIVQVGSLYRGAPYQCFSRSHFCQFLRSSAWGMGR